MLFFEYPWAHLMVAGVLSTAYYSNDCYFYYALLLFDTGTSQELPMLRNFERTFNVTRSNANLACSKCEEENTHE